MPRAVRRQPQDVGKFAKLVALLKAHPRGLNAIQLQHLGYRPETDGTLEEAQKAGLILWVMPMSLLFSGVPRMEACQATPACYNLPAVHSLASLSRLGA